MSSGVAAGLGFGIVWVAMMAWFFMRSRARTAAAPPRMDGQAVEALAERMRSMATAALALRPATSPAFSKLGGVPDLPVGVAWPMGDKRPRAFLAQIDLSAVRAAGGPDWAPAAGRLYAFLDDERWGFPDVVTLIYSPAEPGAPPLADAVAAPAGLRKTDVYPEQAIGFQAMTSVPSLEWLGVDFRTLPADDQAFEELFDMARDGAQPSPMHQIGGFPHEIQDEQLALSCECAARGLTLHWGEAIAPEIATAARDWRLLLQIDSDARLRMNWGDGGLIYVFVREADARAGDFSRSVTLSQTY